MCPRRRASASAAWSREPDARVERRVEDVDERVEQHDEEGAEQRHREDRRHVERADRLGEVLAHALQVEDRASAVIEAESMARGIRFLKETTLKSVNHGKGGFRLELEGAAESLESDALLMATGRSPSTSGLGLEEIGIATEKGRIVIDERCATSRSDVFAAGDCASPVPVVHLAVIQGEVAGKNAVRLVKDGVRDAPAEWNRRSAMTAWFTEPQCVQIGLSLQEAAAQGRPVLSAEADYADHGKGMIAGCRRGFVKIIADAAEGRLLGASGAGPQVAETGHLLQEAIELGLTAPGYLAIPHYHPTFAEAWSRAAEGIVSQLEGI